MDFAQQLRRKNAEVPDICFTLLAPRKFKKMKAFARLQNEIWCMDSAYVLKLAKGNNVVKYLLFRQDLFDRTVDAKE